MTLIKNYFSVTIIIFAIVFFSNLTIAQNKPAQPQPKPAPQVQSIAGLNAKFIVALIDDGEGGAWIGTEDEGIFHCDVDNKISQFTTKNGLGDNNGYALAIDKLGRLWVGHLHSGVSVFNGKDWKNYDVVDGPIGERIFDIKICPKDSNVWLATSAGITRYKIDADEWEHFTREDGLLEDQASALAFKFDGTLIVGTQCHGLAIFTRNSNGSYKHSRDIVAPDRFGPDNCSPVPITPLGVDILPSNQINDIIVTKNSEVETIWIATNAGLVKANSDLKKIEFWRGRDYVNKVRGLYGGAPKDWKEVPKEIIDQLLSEDHLTCLDEDDQGVVWIGTRQNGTMVADPQTGKKSLGNPKAMGYPDSLVTKILNLSGGDYMVGFNGGGVIQSVKPFKLVDRKPAKTKFNKGKIFSVAQNNFPNLPSKIKPPTIEELKKMQVKLDRLRKPKFIDTNLQQLEICWFRLTFTKIEEEKTFNGKNPDQIRKDKCEAFLALSKTIQDLTNPTYVAQPMSMNIFPEPDESDKTNQPLLPNMPPSDIKNLKTRQKYEEALWINSKNIFEYNIQRMMSDLKPKVQRFFLEYVLKTYSDEPRADQELINLLEKYKYPEVEKK